MLGSAAIAVLMDARLAAEGLRFSPTGEGTGSSLPAQVQTPFAEAMAQSMLLPAVVLLLGLLAVLFFERPRHQGWGAPRRPRRRRREAVTAGAYGAHAAVRSRGARPTPA